MRRLLKLAAGQTTVLDGTAAETFALTLKLTVTQIIMRNVVPGQLYVFIVTQDGKGEHQLAWGDQLINGVPVDPSAMASTVQSYVGLPGNLLFAVMPGGWL